MKLYVAGFGDYKVIDGEIVGSQVGRRELSGSGQGQRGAKLAKLQYSWLPGKTLPMQVGQSTGETKQSPNGKLFCL